MYHLYQNICKSGKYNAPFLLQIILLKGQTDGLKQQYAFIFMLFLSHL